MILEDTMKESDIELAICYFLNSLPHSKVYKNAPSGFLFRDKKGTRMRSHKNPFARMKRLDIDWIYKGHLISIEVKTPKEFSFIHRHWDRLKINYPSAKGTNKHYAQQIYTVESLCSAGGIALFVCSLKQVKDLYSSIKVIFNE